MLASRVDRSVAELLDHEDGPHSFVERFFVECGLNGFAIRNSVDCVLSD